MDKGSLTFTVGPARAGKTTYAKTWLQSQLIRSIPSVVIDEDIIRLAHNGERYNHRTEPFIHTVSELFLRTLLDSGYSVLYCETNTSLHSIRNIFKIDPNACPVVFVETLEVLYERARLTDQDSLIDSGVINRHCGQLFELSHYFPKQKKKPGVYPIETNIHTFNTNVQLIGDGITTKFKIPKTYIVKSDHELYNDEVHNRKADFIDRIRNKIEIIRLEVKNNA